MHACDGDLSYGELRRWQLARWLCVLNGQYIICVPNHTNNESIYLQYMVAGATCKKPQIESVSLYYSCDLWELSCIVVVAYLVHNKMHEDLMTEKDAKAQLHP
jgi:hypothetical protein